MFIQKLRLQNCRCFENKTFDFDKKFILIQGANGSGKTTILEALHYGCFLKSFRTNNIRNIVAFQQKHFFLQVNFEEQEGDCNQVQVGVSFDESKPKKLVKFNQKVVKSYKELISRYRIISLAENDLQLVQGAPEVRRYFLNQIAVLFDPDSINNLRKYRQIQEQRNKIILHTQEHDASTNKELEIWSKQLWEAARILQKNRIKYLKELESAINKLLNKAFPSLSFTISFSYQIKEHIDRGEDFDAFWSKYKQKRLFDELRWKRGLFGAHLDDFSVLFHEKDLKSKARHFASRGQQKLVLFLIKIALAQKLEAMNMRVALLLDDFLTDFDHERLSDCLSLLSTLSCQVFITCPLKSFIPDHYANASESMQVITL